MRTNDPQSAYAQHILKNQHEYGPITNTMTLLKSEQKTSMLIPYEQLYTLTYHHNGQLITEQNTGEPNPLLQLVIDTLPTSTTMKKHISTLQQHKPNSSDPSTPVVDSSKGVYKRINNRQNTLYFRTIYYKCILTHCIPHYIL